MKFLTTFILLVCLAGSTVFAQRGSRQQAQQASATTIGPDGLIRLPTRTDSIGIASRNAFNAVQNILNLTTSQPFSFTQVSKQERQARWQQAFDTIEKLAVFVNPPVVEESEQANASQTEEQTEQKAPPFVADPLAKAHYHLGKGMIYKDMAASRLFTQDSAKIFAKAAVENLEAYVANGVGSSALVYTWLSPLYSDYLSNPGKALEYLDKGIAADPKNAFLYISKFRILQGLGRMAEACAALRQASALGEDVAINMMQAFNCR